MKKILSFLSFSLCTILLSQTYAQTTTGGLSGNDLANILAGQGVSITNVVLNCPGVSSGSFSGGNATNIGLDMGVILTSGNISNTFGPNNAGNTSVNNGGGGDPDLTAASGFATQNACILEFDFVPSANGLSVDYVFASEEYNEWVCTQFNDVFAFFVSGPNPAGGSYTNQNIALVPVVGSPVAINTINNGTAAGNSMPCDLGNSAFHIDNIGGATVQYDGFTTVLNASLDLVPCQSYHFKFAIADASDALWDSAVFIEAASFQTNNIVATATDAQEGCPGGEIVFTSTLPNITGYTITINVLGTSTASPSDYEPFQLNYLLPAGQQSLTVPIVAVPDLLVEGTETIDFEFTYDAGCNPTTDNASINVTDGPMTIDLGDLCRPVYLGYAPLECTDITATVSGGNPPYTYAWSNGDATQTISVCPATTTTYNVTVTDADGCVQPSETVEVEVVDVRCGRKMDKVLVCHVPPGNPANEHNICISSNAVLSHLGLHGGDYLGVCGEFPCDGMIFPVTFNPSGNSHLDPSKEQVYDQMLIYPNPTSGGVTIEVPDTEIRSIEILEVSGKIALDNINFIKGDQKLTIKETGSLDAGIYIIKVSSVSGEVYLGRFVKY